MPELELEQIEEQVEDERLNWGKGEQMIEDDDTRRTEVHQKLADLVNKKYKFKTMRDSERVWVYTNPTYHEYGEQAIKQELRNQIGSYLKRKDISEVVHRIKYTNIIERPIEGQHKEYIPLKNGWYNIEEEELQEPNPDKFITNSMPIEYDPDAECPKIKEFMHEVVDDESVPILQEMAGYCMYRGYPIAKAFMLLGGGKNGKSTFLDLLIKFLGEENVATPSLHRLVTKQNAAARLYGKLANINADLSSRKLPGTGNFKRLTGNDTMEGRRLYETGFEFKNYAKLIYAANNLPGTTETTDAFFRRWVIVKFPYKFTDNPNDGHKDKEPNKLDELTTDEELAGFFNWALEGLQRVLDNGEFTKSSTIEETKERWMSQTNPIEMFLEKYCEFNGESQVPKDDFRDAVNKFAEKNGAETKKKGQITKKLSQEVPGFDTSRPKIDGERVNCYKGLFVTDKWKHDVRAVRATRSKSKRDARACTRTLKKDYGNNPDDPDTLIKEEEILEIYPDSSDSPITYFELEQRAEEKGIDPEKFNEYHEHLIENGDIFEPKSGKFKRT